MAPGVSTTKQGARWDSIATDGIAKKKPGPGRAPRKRTCPGARTACGLRLGKSGRVCYSPPTVNASSPVSARTTGRNRLSPGWAGLLLCAALLLPAPASATTVTPPTFAELVAEAQLIVRGRVDAVRTAWVDSPQGRVIKTYVTVAVLKPLKGGAPATFTLQLLGGEIDGQGMQVAGMPRFQPGQVEFLFISGNGVRFCPLVGMMHGRYRVLTDPTTAREYVARDDGAPLESEHEVQLPQPASALVLRYKTPASALTPLVFEQRIAGELTRHATQP